MENSKLAKVIITGLAGLSMGGALMAPAVLSHSVNAARVARVAKRHAKRHGLVTIKGKKYYYNVKGRRLKGWRTIRVHGRKYRVYLSKKNGAMLTGFRKIKAHRYYFSKKTGNMFRGTHKIGSRTYVFSKHGRLIKSSRAKKKAVKVARNNKKTASKAVKPGVTVMKIAPIKGAARTPINKIYQPMSKEAGFEKIKAMTAKTTKTLPKTFNGMYLPGFDYSNPNKHETAKNGYDYINGAVQGKLVYPVAVKTMEVHGSTQKVVIFSNNVGLTERYLNYLSNKSYPMTQSRLRAWDDGMPKDEGEFTLLDVPSV